MMGIEEKKGLVFDWVYSSVQGALNYTQIQLGKTDSEIGLDPGASLEYAKELMQEGWLELYGKDGVVRLTVHGQQLGQNGGYQAYLKRKLEQAEQEQNRAQLTAPVVH